MRGEVTIELPSNPHWLGVVRVLVEKWCGQAGFAEQEARRITLAVDEALANIMRHAYGNRPDEWITASLVRDDHGVRFVLEDTGAPVDHTLICKHPPDELHPGGRGTHFIREIMDEVEYETLPSRNRVRLVKYRPRDPS
jgi:anti-sigma regulatory factor (Ser/Thr protein kinase)